MTFGATVPAWAVQVATLPGRCIGARESAVCEGVNLGREIYGENEGAQFAAFAYLWRRFGPPWFGSDEYKDLVGYILGTPHPQVFLTLGLSASPLEYAVGYLITNTLAQSFGKCGDAWEEQFQAKQFVEGALTAALTELLRPVFVRDVAINILGRVSDSDLDARVVASPSPYAGYGIPQGAMDALIAAEERAG